MSEITIHNSQTNEVVTREMTAQELSEYETTVKNAELRVKKRIEQENARSALLLKLGITEEEAKLLLS